MVNRGTWIHAGDSAAVDTAAMPHPAGSIDSLKRGLGLLARGTWTHSGESLAINDTIIPNFTDLMDSIGFYATNPVIAGWGVEIHDDSAGSDRVSIRRTDTDTAYLAIGGKAADASGADSADVGVVSRSCTGNAATADSSKGGSARATLAAYATKADTMWQHKQTLTIASGHTTWALASGGYGRLLMSSNDTLNSPTGVTNGKTYTLKLVQDGTGSRLMSWPANIRFPGAVAPTLTATRMKCDIFSFVGDMDSMLLCTGAGFSYATSDTL
jgi:hypothetical protein